MRIKIGDGKLFFDVDGAMLVADGPRMRERPTLVLLHGGPGMDHSVFKPDLNPLTRVAQLVYLDLRSAGRSDRTLPKRWTLDDWADDVVEFCDALEIAKPDAEDIAAGIPARLVRFERFPDAGHTIVPDAPDRFLRVLADFLTA
jgi:pimeloyl-ACP methyl ester carboxylesterase